MMTNRKNRGGAALAAATPSPAQPAAQEWCGTCIEVTSPQPNTDQQVGDLLHGSRQWCGEAVRAGWARPAEQPLNEGAVRDAPGAPPPPPSPPAAEEDDKADA